jgi:excisionase family DNA binding protein
MQTSIDMRDRRAISEGEHMAACGTAPRSIKRAMTREGTGAVSTGKFSTIDDVADLLGVSTRTVRRSIDRKQLVAHKFGRAVRIAESDLRAFIATHRDP